MEHNDRQTFVYDNTSAILDQWAASLLDPKALDDFTVNIYRQSQALSEILNTRATPTPAIFGLGFPFYGNIDLRKAMRHTDKQYAHGELNYDSNTSAAYIALHRKIPDIDLAVVYDPIDALPLSRQAIRTDWVNAFSNFVMPIENDVKEALGITVISYIGKIPRSDYAGHIAQTRRFIQQQLSENSPLRPPVIELVPIPTDIFAVSPFLFKKTDSSVFPTIYSYLLTMKPLVAQKKAFREVPSLWLANTLMESIAITQVTSLNDLQNEHIRWIQDANTNVPLIELFPQIRELIKEKVTIALSMLLNEGFMQLSDSDIQGDPCFTLTQKGQSFYETISNFRNTLLADTWSYPHVLQKMKEIDILPQQYAALAQRQ